MKKALFYSFALMSGLSLLGADTSVANFVQFVPGAGTNTDANNANTSSYMDTQVQAQLHVQVDKDVDAVHFIRDNNDPKTITKTYVLKYATDPYALRGIIREMVQVKRVYGSNTAVECIKFDNGVAMLFISAEDFRFKDHENGMGLDSIVAELDKPGITYSSGQPKYTYFPANVPADTLALMVKNDGMTVVDDKAELIGGKDKVMVDPDLNCLFFNTATFSRRNIETMLQKYDLPLPEMKIRFTVYEIYAENDDKIGLDFQAWKNNDGYSFFSVGGRYRDNWSAANGGLNKSLGSERTSYYNFNPKWNSRYLDFISSRGKARIAHTAEIVVRQNSTSSLNRTTKIFYMDKTQKPPLVEAPTTDNGNPAAALASAITAIGKTTTPANDIKIDKDTQENVVADNVNSFGLNITVAATSIAPKATLIKFYANNISLIGYQSSGAPRLERSEIGNTTNPIDIMVSTEKNQFIVGGLEKMEVVRDSVGVPWLKDLPGIGYAFSTETESTHKSQLAIVATCEYVYPETDTIAPYKDQIGGVNNATADAGEKNKFFFKQYFLDKQ